MELTLDRIASTRDSATAGKGAILLGARHPNVSRGWLAEWERAGSRVGICLSETKRYGGGVGQGQRESAPARREQQRGMPNVV